MVKWARRRAQMGLLGFGYPWEVGMACTLVVLINHDYTFCFPSNRKRAGI